MKYARVCILMPMNWPLTDVVGHRFYMFYSTYCSSRGLGISADFQLRSSKRHTYTKRNVVVDYFNFPLTSCFALNCVLLVALSFTYCRQVKRMIRIPDRQAHPEPGYIVLNRQVLFLFNNLVKNVCN